MEASPGIEPGCKDLQSPAKAFISRTSGDCVATVLRLAQEAGLDFGHGGLICLVRPEPLPINIERDPDR